MSEENAASNAGEVKQPVSKSVVTDSDLLAAVLSQMEGKAKGSQSEPKPEPEEVPEAAPEVTEQSSGDQPAVEAESQQEGDEAKTKQEESAVLSKIDFEQLSEAEAIAIVERAFSKVDLAKLPQGKIQELANIARSRGLSRFSEFSNEIKQLRHELAEERAAKQKLMPLEVAPQVPKEYASIEKMEDLLAKLSEAKATMKWAEAELDNAEHLAATDTIETPYGTFTKAKLKEFYRTSREAKDEWIPAQHAELTKRAQRAAQREELAQRAKNELKWMDGEDNDVRKQYEALAKNPAIDKIKKAVPEAEVDIEYILAHAVNSICGKTYYNVATGEQAKPSVTLKPPAAVKSAAAPRASESLVRQVKELESKFEATRSDKDLEALLTARSRAKRV